MATPHVLTVLIVDDDPDVAAALAYLVHRAGHEAHAAYSPVEAIQMTDADPPDVVIVDIGLPGSDGYALGRKLAQRLTRRPLLVALTGQDGLEGRSRADGFDHHLRKPADRSQILAVLAAHAERLAAGT